MGLPSRSLKYNITENIVIINFKVLENIRDNLETSTWIYIYCVVVYYTSL